MLCLWEKHLMLFTILGPSSLSVVVDQSDEKHANRTASVLCWSGMTNTKHTSGSNEEKALVESRFVYYRYDVQRSYVNKR